MRYPSLFLSKITYQLLVNSLRLSNDTPHHALPLLFKSARYKNTLNGLHPFSSMFNAMDICRQESPINVAWQRKPSITTILSLPLIEIFNVAPTNVKKLEFLQHESVKVSKVQGFLEYNHDQGQFQFKPKTTCSKRYTWNKLHKAFNKQEITFKAFVHRDNTDDGLEFQPFVDTLIYQQQPILRLPNSAIRFIMLGMAKLDVGRKFNNNLTKKQWKTFYKNNMHYSARNPWYRMLHQQTSNNLAMYQRNLSDFESDKCQLCNEMEDAKHLLVSCVHKLDVWDSSFHEVLGYPKTANPHLIYKSIM